MINGIRRAAKIHTGVLDCLGVLQIYGKRTQVGSFECNGILLASHLEALRRRPTLFETLERTLWRRLLRRRKLRTVKEPCDELSN